MSLKIVSNKATLPAALNKLFVEEGKGLKAKANAQLQAVSGSRWKLNNFINFSKLTVDGTNYMVMAINENPCPTPNSRWFRGAVVSGLSIKLPEEPTIDGWSDLGNALAEKLPESQDDIAYAINSPVDKWDFDTLVICIGANFVRRG